MNKVPHEEIENLYSEFPFLNEIISIGKLIDGENSIEIKQSWISNELLKQTNKKRENGSTVLTTNYYIVTNHSVKRISSGNDDYSFFSPFTWSKKGLKHETVGAAMKRADNLQYVVKLVDLATFGCTDGGPLPTLWREDSYSLTLYKLSDDTLSVRESVEKFSSTENKFRLTYAEFLKKTGQ
jgi:hypothetical protein